jgi:hypothetical protein
MHQCQLLPNKHRVIELDFDLFLVAFKVLILNPVNSVFEAVIFLES